MEHQSFFPMRQVHLVSTAGVPTNNGETLADLTFFFKSPIVYIPSSYDVNLACISASIPYVWGNINTTNNVFSVRLDSGPSYSVTLTPGNYSMDDIVAVLGTQIPALTFSYSANTHLITITTPNTFDNFVITDSSLSPFLGFTVLVSNTQTLTSTVPVNMIRTSSVYVETPDLLNESFDSRTGGQSGVLCRIPVSGTPWNLLTWTNIFGTHTMLDLKQINHVRVRLIDDQRNTLDLREFTWSVTLQFSVVEATPFVEGEWLQTTH